jgi:hypothetical protein
MQTHCARRLYWHRACQMLQCAAGGLRALAGLGDWVGCEQDLTLHDGTAGCNEPHAMETQPHQVKGYMSRGPHPLLCPP